MSLISMRYVLCLYVGLTSIAHADQKKQPVAAEAPTTVMSTMKSAGIGWSYSKDQDKKEAEEVKAGGDIRMVEDHNGALTAADVSIHARFKTREDGQDSGKLGAGLKTNVTIGARSGRIDKCGFAGGIHFKLNAGLSIGGNKALVSQTGVNDELSAEMGPAVGMACTYSDRTAVMFMPNIMIGASVRPNALVSRKTLGGQLIIMIDKKVYLMAEAGTNVGSHKDSEDKDLPQYGLDAYGKLSFDARLLGPLAFGTELSLEKVSELPGAKPLDLSVPTNTTAGKNGMIYGAGFSIKGVF